MPNLMNPPESKTIVIMQPTYLPWLGYLDLIDQADVFVFLDSVPFDHRSWQQRNRLKSPQGEFFLTVPVISKGRRGQPIREVEIDGSRSFERKHLKSLDQFYAKAAFFDAYRPLFVEIWGKNHAYLADLNMDFIRSLMRVLRIETPVLRSSDLNVRGEKSTLLLDICEKVGGTRYLSPRGAEDYLIKDNAFEKSPVCLDYHRYEHPAYRQLWGEFISHLSTVDMIMNVGPDGLNVIRRGRSCPAQNNVA